MPKPDTAKTIELLGRLMEQLHKDNETLQTLIETYSQNTERLTELAASLVEKLNQERAETQVLEEPGVNE